MEPRPTISPYFEQMGPRGPVTAPAWPAVMLAHHWDPAAKRPEEDLMSGRLEGAAQWLWRVRA
ncbi:hypothetical protein GCM10010336_71590 [Streptomyces goshikiensis]|nr:hypothetical protein GCM10010336_71590 [Streptomyces goshikiensis]